MSGLHAPKRKADLGSHDPFLEPLLQALAALTGQPHLRDAQQHQADKLITEIGARRFYTMVQRVRSQTGETDPDGWWVLQDAAYAQGKKVRVLAALLAERWRSSCAAVVCGGSQSTRCG